MVIGQKKNSYFPEDEIPQFTAYNYSGQDM